MVALGRDAPAVPAGRRVVAPGTRGAVVGGRVLVVAVVGAAELAVGVAG
jgi:hypothetical protein